MSERDLPQDERRSGRGVSKLSEGQVREIRALARKPCPVCGAMPSLRMLAEKFDVTPPAILAVVERRTWAHVPEREGDAAAVGRPTDPAEQARLRDAADMLRRQGVQFGTLEMLQFAATVLDAAKADAAAQG